MARDSSLYVRKAVIRRLKGLVALQAFVGDRVYPPQRPAKPLWPFVGYGVPTITPFRAACMDGCDVRPVIHAYAATGDYGGQTRSGEAVVADMLALISAELDGATIDLAAYADCPYAATAFLEWTSSQVIQDSGEADNYHGIGSFEIAVSS